MGALATSATAETMTVAVCAGGGAVRVESRPRPEPGPGEIRLRLRVAGLCGTDLFKLQHDTAAPGSVLGHEIVGTVDAVGEGVVGYAIGDRVAVPHHVACGVCALCRRGSEPLCPAFRENLLFPGGFSESVLVRERAMRQAVFGLPDHLSDEAAVFLEPAACVARGVRRSRLAEIALPGEEPAVAVLGAGSMGLLHLLVLKALFPAVRIAVSDPLEDRCRIALGLGADAAAPPAEIRDAVTSLSGGLGADGADVVFDTVGGAGPLEDALALSRPGGTTVLFAHASPLSPHPLAPSPGDGRNGPAEGRGGEGSGGGERAGFDLNAFFKSERKLIATYSSSLADQRDAFRLLATRRLDPSPLVTHQLPLSRFAEAVELARERRALKVLLLPEGETP
ncbi:MAG TPA: alcohol dehydrogenase catalytic domain-containing protein [Thermoanaerobaculia bacterium]